jgi:DNA-binding transcriptional LysR family regulator
VLLADELHFGRAAARAHLSRASFSEQVARLETELGVTLFERTSRRVVPTAAGEEAVEHARTVLDQVDRLRRDAAARAGLDRTRLEVGLAAAAIDLTPAVLRRVATDHPELTLRLRQFDFGDPTAGLSSGLTQAALVWGPFTTTGLRVRRLRSEPTAVLLPAGHRLAGREQLALADLAGERWCDGPSDDPVWRATWVPGLGTADGVSVRLGDVARSPDGIVEIVAAGRGAALLPRSIADRLALPGVCAVPLADGPTCQVAVATPSRPTPAAQAFVRSAVAAARGAST